MKVEPQYLTKKARDLITGLEGIVVVETHWLHADVRLGIQPMKLQDGKPGESQYFDRAQLSFPSPDEDRDPQIKISPFEVSFKLGSEVRDTITGYSGVAVAMSYYLNGCVHYVVQAKGLDKDKKPIESQSFEQGRLVLTAEPAQPRPEGKRPGGPNIPPARRDASR